MAATEKLTREQVIADVYDEWIQRGAIHDPADGIRDDQDEAFWAEVERRLSQ